MNKNDIRKIEHELELSLFAEPPMRVIRNGRSTNWTGYRAVRRGEPVILVSTKDVERLARSASILRTWASVTKKTSRSKAAA
ncbi:hypothetical protein [Vulcanococcus sp.]|uniref:hypothetical protein n=1 Tax=Vulcanococcus sp. TaxID=2856995 RepID=UPI003C03C801